MAYEVGPAIRNNMLVEAGRPLSVETHTPYDLLYVLSSLGREAIIHSIEATYAQALDQNPDATLGRPSLQVMSLGSNPRSILTPFGSQNRTSISRSIIELQPHLRDYWHAVSSHDFTPEVRRFSVGKKDSIALMLRNPETDPKPITPLEHLPRALGFVEPAATAEYTSKLAEALASDDTEGYRALWQQLEDENEAAIDRQVQSYNDSVLPPAQIGRVIAMANMKASLRGESYLLNENGYLTDLADAEEGAYQYGLTEVSELLKDEMLRVKSLTSSH